MAAGNIANIKGFVTQSEMDIITMGTLEHLYHNSLGMMFSASPENPKTVNGGGTAIWRFQEMSQTEEYTAANRNTAPGTTESDIKKVDVLKSIRVFKEIETLELDQFTPETRSQYVSKIQSSMQRSLTALLDAHTLTQAVLTCAEANRKATQEIVISDIDALDTEAKQKAAYRTIAKAKVAISRGVDKYNIGTDRDSFVTFLHEGVTLDLMLGQPKGGDSATRIGKELTAATDHTIAGLGAVKDCIFLDKKIDKTTSFSKDEDFDFTGVFGAIIHKQALFIAIGELHFSQVVLPHSGNIEFIIKTNLYRGHVRPDLVNVIRKTASQ